VSGSATFSIFFWIFAAAAISIGHTCAQYLSRGRLRPLQTRARISSRAEDGFRRARARRAGRRRADEPRPREARSSHEGEALDERVRLLVGWVEAHGRSLESASRRFRRADRPPFPSHPARTLTVIHPMVVAPLCQQPALVQEGQGVRCGRDEDGAPPRADEDEREQIRRGRSRPSLAARSHPASLRTTSLPAPTPLFPALARGIGRREGPALREPHARRGDGAHARAR
jgi:hypothetical protein